MNKSKKNGIVLIISLSLLLVLCSFVVYSLPAAPGLSFISNSTSNSAGVGQNLSAGEDLGGGYIITINLDVLQQNLRWKAYVGNVTGRLILEDSQGYSIYEWAAITSKLGKVFASRNGTLDWSTVNCSNRTSSVVNEESALGILDNDINKTFNYSAHMAFEVAGRGMISNDCPSVATFYNNSVQTPSADAKFQEVLLSDNYGNGNLIYTSIMNQSQIGYRNDTNFDFQMIVADQDNAPITNYFFYVELGI